MLPTTWVLVLEAKTWLCAAVGLGWWSAPGEALTRRLKLVAAPAASESEPDPGRHVTPARVAAAQINITITVSSTATPSPSGTMASPFAFAIPDNTLLA